MLRLITENSWVVEHSPALRRLAIVVGCLLGAIVFGRLAMSDRLPLIVGGIVGLAALAMLAFKPDWAIIALVATTLFLPFGFSTGTQSPITIALAFSGALTAAWLVRMIVEQKRIQLTPLPVNIPLIAFAGIAILSYLWSGTVHDPFVDNWDSFAKSRLGSLGTFVLSPAVVLLFANHLTRARHLRIVFGLFFAASLLGLVSGYTDTRIPFLNTRGLFPLWAVTLTAGQALFNRTLSGRMRAVLGVIALAWFYYQFSYGQTWKSGWLPPLAALFILGILRSRKLLALMVAGGAIFVAANFDFISASLQAEDTESGVTRVAAWQANWNVTSEHLLLGTGPAGYAAYYMTYFPTAAMATHNNYVDIVAQTGLLGLAVFAWFFVATGRSAWRVTKRVPEEKGFEFALAHSLLAGFGGLVMAMALGDWFIPFAYTQGIAGFDYTVWGWMMIGLIMALYRRYVAAPITGQGAPASEPDDRMPGAARAGRSSSEIG